MVLIAVDPHKSSHYVRVVDDAGRRVTQRRFDAEQPETLRVWAMQWPRRWWAVEGARGIGHALSQQLCRAGEEVRDVPAKLVARTRTLSGLGSKTDAEDAQAVAQTALGRREQLARVRQEDERSVLGLRTRRRGWINVQRTQVVGYLHELLRELGVAPRGELSARTAAAACERARPQTTADAERLTQVRELVIELERLDAQLSQGEREAKHLVRASGTTLTNIVGIGALGAQEILGRVGPIDRFATRDHFARHTGTAPLEASSGDVVRHRLNRRGDRRLNSVLHIAAITQRRVPGPGRDYYERKRAEGKSHREALRCLKRRISDAVFRALVADAAAAALNTAA